MKLLTIYKPENQLFDSDFCHGIDGELAIAFFTGCRKPDCGCDRSLSGLNSAKASTTVMVADLDLDHDDAVNACIGFLDSAQWSDIIGNPHEVRELADHLITLTARVAADFDDGDILRAKYLHDEQGWRFDYYDEPPEIEPADIPVSLCADCSINVTPNTPSGSHDWQVYIVSDAVWESAGMGATDDDGYLCIDCLEKRLGRLLTPADFPHIPLNDPVMADDTPRLAALKRRAWTPCSSCRHCIAWAKYRALKSDGSR